MKKSFSMRLVLYAIVFFAFLTTRFSMSQNITITDDDGYTPDDAAMLDVKSDTKGFLVPRVALSTDPIPGTKPEGLLVWNTSTSGAYDTPGFYFWNGSDWEMISSSSTYNFGNGLTESDGNVIFGGTLNQNTTLNQGDYNLDINLNGTGDFSIQDAGSDVFQVTDVGEIKIDDHVMIEGNSNCKVYRNLVSYTANAGTGAFIINTSQPASSNCMFSIKVEGYFWDNSGPFQIVVGARTLGTGFDRMGYMNIGSLKVPIRLARNISTQNVALIIGDVDEPVDYPKLTVTQFIQGHNGREESYAQGWTITRATSFTGYNNITLIPDKTDASGFWSISGDNVYLNDTTNNVGIGVLNPTGKLEIKGDVGAADDDPIFEVKNKYGQVVFGVYHEGVRVYVDDMSKGTRGGFAVGGFSSGKGPTNEYLRVTPDSVRVYVAETAKGTRGGFAVGGFSSGKGLSNEYLSVTPDSVRVYVADGAKGTRGGFAVGGFSSGKGLTNEYLRVTPDSVRVYIDETTGKGTRGGFAVGGFSSGKGMGQDFLNIVPDSTRVYVDGKGGFAVDNIATGFEGRYVDLTPENYLIGHSAGDAITTGLYNSFIGYESGMSNQGGSDNVFLGYNSGINNIAGDENVFLGNYAGEDNNADYNTFLGSEAGKNFTSGESNVIIGRQAGLNYNSGSNNVFIGAQAAVGETHSTGGFNVVIGMSTGYELDDGACNVFIGNQSGYENTDGGYNVYVGFRAGYNSTYADNNVYLGTDCGYLNTSGENNVFIGYRAGMANTTADFNTFIGYESGFNNTYGGVTGDEGHFNTFLGYQAGYSNTSGSRNTFLGYQAGYSNSTGINNVCIGPLSGFSISTGAKNVMIGNAAGYSITNAEFNICIGDSAGFNYTQSSGLFIGVNAGKNNNNILNSFIGSHAGEFNTGLCNTFLGNLAGWTNDGHYNTFIGQAAGFANSSGWHNTYLGFGAGGNSDGSDNVFIGVNTGNVCTGSDNVFIGNSVDLNGSNILAIDNEKNTAPLIYGEFDNDMVRINGNLTVKDSLIFGNGWFVISNGWGGTVVDSRWTSNLAGLGVGDFTAINSAYSHTDDYEPGSIVTSRFYPLVVTIGNYGTPYYDAKMYINYSGEVFMPDVYGSTVSGRDLYIASNGQLGYVSSSVRYKKKITDMETVDWLYNLRPVNFIYKNDSTNTKQYGLIAEEVEKINPSFVSYKEDGSVETVSYGHLVTPLLKALQDQQNRISELENENEDLKQSIEDLYNKYNELIKD